MPPKNAKAAAAGAASGRFAAVTEFPLAPRGLAVLRDGTFVASTVHGLVTAQLLREDAGRAAQTVIPIAKGRPAALVGASPREHGAYAWLALDGAGRVVLRRSASEADDIVASVPGATAIYATDAYAVVMDGSATAHCFLVPPALLEAADTGDAIPELRPLGAAPMPEGLEDDFIGVAVSGGGAADGSAAIASFALASSTASSGEVEHALHVSVASISAGAPAAVAWVATMAMPNDDLPVAWAVAADASAVVVVPAPGRAPLVFTPASAATAAGAAACPALERDLAPAGGACVAVAPAGTGFLFARRPAGNANAQVDIVYLPSVVAAAVTVVGSLEKLQLRKATGVALATHRAAGAGAATIGWHARLLVGRTLYTVALTGLQGMKGAAASAAAAVPQLPGDTSAGAAKAVAAAGAPPPPAEASAQSTTLQLLAGLAAAGGVAERKGAPAPAAMAAALEAKQPAARGFVLRDAGVAPATLATSAPVHAVLDACLDRVAASASSSSSLDAAAAVEPIARYFGEARDVEASSVVHVAYRLAAAFTTTTATSAASKKAKGGAKKAAAEDATTTTTTTDEAALAVALGHVLHPCAVKVRGSLHAAWAAYRRDDDAGRRPAVVHAVFAAAYAVLLHAFTTGRLDAGRVAMGVMDAAMVADCDALLRADRAGVVAKAQTLLASVGRWGSTEPGYRLGQLTAHSGPQCPLVKEAQVAPQRGHKINTTALVRVVRERQAL